MEEECTKYLKEVNLNFKKSSLNEVETSLQFFICI